MPALHEAPWCRRDQPVLSALTSEEEWRQVVCYTPSVAAVDGGYRMWYLGCSDQTREGVMEVGLAESEDGIHFEPRPENPVLRAGDLPWGRAWQTPDVHYDGDRYRMWFVGSNGGDGRQQLGYAESADGVDWEVHPEPLYRSARGPCVRETDEGYEMWACSAPDPDDPARNEGRSDIVQYIYRFESPDGIEWTREDEPAVTTGGRVDSVVYPEVVETDDGYVMFYASHLVDGDEFEMHCATSPDGREWTTHHDASSFPATRHPDDFDGRYTSTPCVLDCGDRYRLYYSARDWGTLYGGGDGTVKVDSMGIYRHVGVAELATSWLERAGTER
jgi:predicted GH43/DUF377 family glycosyl hydrolase